MLSTNNVTADDSVTNVGIFLAVVASAISVTAVVLNLLLMYVIYKTRNLHTCTNGFIISLCVAELLVAVFTVPFAAVSKLSRAWVFSNSFCSMSGFVYNVGRNGAAYSLMMVCVDRCVAVSKPLKYSNIITPRTAVIMATFVWGQSILIALIPFFGQGVYTFMLKFSLCMLLGDANSVHMLVKEVFGCLIPALIILITVVKIIKEAKSHHRVFAAVPTPRTSETASRTSSYSRNALKAMRALFVIILSYAMFCIPLSVLKIIHQTCCHWLSEHLVTSFVWLSFLCCVINPIVIATMNRKFKQSFMVHVCVCGKSSGREPLDKDGFTITSGLHTVLDASLLVSIKVGHDRMSRRHKLSHSNMLTASTKIQAAGKGFRKTQSSPELPIAGMSKDS